MVGPVVPTWSQESFVIGSEWQTFHKRIDAIPVEWRRSKAGNREQGLLFFLSPDREGATYTSEEADLHQKRSPVPQVLVSLGIVVLR